MPEQTGKKLKIAVPGRTINCHS